MIYEVMSAEPIASILFPFELAPLRFFNFADNGGDDHIALQLYSGALKGLDCVRVANQCALHVVNAEAVNQAILDDCLRLVTDASEKFFAASVRCIHVAVEHQVLPAAGTSPTADNVRAAFFDFLPSDVQPELF